MIDTYRSIARWLVSTFGAVAGALLVGLQLSSLGQLTGEDLEWSLICVGVVFLAILTVIGAALRVLAPIRATYRGLPTARDFAALRDVMNKEQPGGTPAAQQLQDLVNNFEAVLTQERQAYEAREANRSEETAVALATASERAEAWDRRISEKMWQGRALRTKQLFNQASATIFAAIILAATAATGFAYLTTKPTKTPGPPSATIAVDELTTCVDLYVALDQLADDEHGIGAYLPTQTLGAHDQACGFHNATQLARFVKALAAK